MDELDRINTFDWDDFRPEPETPRPTPPPTPEEEEEEKDFPASLPAPRPTWSDPAETCFLSGSNESDASQTAKRLITLYGNNSNYKVKVSRFNGYIVRDLQDFVAGVQTQRKGQDVSPQQLQEGKRALKRTPPKETRYQPASDWETQEDEQDPELWPECEDWETEGSAFGKAADNMIRQLYVGLGSMRAGNSSTKLRKKVSALVQKLLCLCVINEF